MPGYRLKVIKKTHVEFYWHVEFQNLNGLRASARARVCVLQVNVENRQKNYKLPFVTNFLSIALSSLSTVLLVIFHLFIGCSFPLFSNFSLNHDVFTF